MKPEYRKLLMKNTKLLLQNVSLANQLLTILETEGVISGIERRRIKTGEVEEDRVQKLLDFLYKKDDSAFSLFCLALAEDEQTHLANTLEAAENAMLDAKPPTAAENTRRKDVRTEAQEEIVDDDVMAALELLAQMKINPDDATYEKWEQALRRKRCKLLDAIQPSVAFLEKLFESGVLNKGSKDTIAVKPTDYEKVATLLDYMIRRSRKDLLSFQEALVYDNQTAALDIFNE